ncbi:MAG TPA: 4Fe-4S binding protein [Thermoguttaceae bacterium]|nr:4Fe-4S binding protein [Thermoguttaceae bacterium]
MSCPMHSPESPRPEKSDSRSGPLTSVDRRQFLTEGVRAAGAVLLGAGAVGLAAHSGEKEPMVWQIDPDLCTACGRCATECVLDPSAVKAVQFYPLCAMCDVCTGYFDPNHRERTTAAENQICPTGAIRRVLVAEQAGVPRFEYHIDEPLCIGCGKCVVGCAMMNGSLYLQVRHDRCCNCNQCTIALACPAQAFRRVPASRPYLLKRKAQAILAAKEHQG